MVEPRSDNPRETSSETRREAGGVNKLTVFGEPLWFDALKTMGVAIVMLLITVVLGGLLAMLIIAPWGRASHDCSIWCVMEQKIEVWISDESS